MRILIVDDDYISRIKISIFLRAYGQCDAVPNGTIACLMFREAHKELVPYDLVTMDIQMPDMPGQKVITQIRAIEKDLQIGVERQAKILVVTVKKEPEEVNASCGCTGYISKPVTKENLGKALDEMGIRI